MESSKNFRELIVWQKAHQFVLNAYDFTSKFPKEEIYGLTSQFRRASVSIAFEEVSRLLNSYSSAIKNSA